MKKNEKRFVTRQRYYGISRAWGIWDKVTCEWYNAGYFGREDALRVADKLNKEN